MPSTAASHIQKIEAREAAMLGDRPITIYRAETVQAMRFADRAIAFDRYAGEQREDSYQAYIAASDAYQRALADLLGRPLTEREAEITAAHRMARYATELAWTGQQMLGIKGNYVRWQEAIENLAFVEGDLNAVLATVVERVAA